MNKDNTDIVWHTYLFPNNNVATFGYNSNNGDAGQLTDLQGQYTKELHEKILARSDERTQFHGFPTLKKLSIIIH